MAFRRRRLVWLALGLAGVLIALPVGAQGGCRADRLGNTVCRDLPGRAAPLRLGRAPPAIPRDGPREQVVLPSTRTDAFGTTRPEPRPVLRQRPFGERPRPEAPARACGTDAFGNVRCR